MAERIYVCNVDDIECEDVERFDHGGKTYAIIRSPNGSFHATDGFCTHERAHLAEGLVDEFEIECPRHHGAFDYRTGMATVAPACDALQCHPVDVKDGKVYLVA